MTDIEGEGVYSIVSRGRRWGPMVAGDHSVRSAQTQQIDAGKAIRFGQGRSLSMARPLPSTSYTTPTRGGPTCRLV